MAVSRSTPRLRATVALLAGVVALVAVSERPLLAGLAGIVAQFAGFACIAAAALGRVWTSMFIAGFKDARLVRAGPYAVLRHPLYALSMLAMLGVGLVSRSLVITLALTAVFGVLYAVAARAEDASLAGTHGPEFERYRHEVRGFRPRRAADAIPDSLDVRPRVLRKAFLDAGSLLGLSALLQAVDALQQAGLTPTWLELP